MQQPKKERLVRGPGLDRLYIYIALPLCVRVRVSRRQANQSGEAKRSEAKRELSQTSLSTVKREIGRNERITLIMNSWDDVGICFQHGDIVINGMTILLLLQHMSEQKQKKHYFSPCEKRAPP